MEEREYGLHEVTNKYKVKTTPIDNGKGYWSYLNVEIFEGENKIGEYIRNYSTLYNTFVPFVQNGKEYALYSKNYTATRVMELPSCKDLCGEENNQYGFCPTGYYVPYTTEDMLEYEDEDGKVIGPNGQFGFVCGCVWGDDTCWKVQYLDLTKISEGILVREARFGYIELFGSSSEIHKLIRVSEFTDKAFNEGNERAMWEARIEIATPVVFDLKGKKIWTGIDHQ